jgi:hypothetical protein
MCNCYLFDNHQEIGMPAEYVNRLARMFQDIKVSQDMNQEFKEATRNNNEILAGIHIVCTMHARVIAA